MPAEAFPVTVVAAGGLVQTAIFEPATGRVYGLQHGFLRTPDSAPEALRKAWGYEPLLKAVTAPKHTALQPDEHWITMHPHGNVMAEGGVHVLVKEHPDGTSHVIAGAKGALNGTRLTRISTPEEWAKRAKQRSAAKSDQRDRAVKLNQQEYERATPEQRKAIDARRKEVAVGKEQLEKQRQEAASGLARALGIEVDPEKGPSRKDIAQAKRYIRTIQAEVIKKHNAQVASNLGDVPIAAIDMPEVDASGKGYRDTLAALAKENGLEVQASNETLNADAAKSGNADPAQVGNEEPTETAAERSETMRRFVQENPEKAHRALLAHEKLLDAERKAKRLTAEEQTLSTSGKVGSGAAEFVDTPLSDDEAEQAAAEALSQQATTDALRGLLNAVTDFEQTHGSMQRHVLSARHAQLSALYSSVTGMPLPIDRRVSDTLGIDASAALTAAMIEQQVGTALDPSARKLAQRHIDTQEAAARGAVDEAEKMLSLAESLGKDLPDVAEADVNGLMLIQMRNNERQKQLEAAGEKLGHAIGQVEAAGQLNSSLRLGVGDILRAGFGSASAKKVAAQLTALGLAPEDFDIRDDAGSTVAHIATKAAVAKLTEPVDTEAARDYADAQDIKAGLHDEEGWLPEGVVKRVSSEVKTDWQPAYEFKPDDDFTGLKDEALKSKVAQYVGEFLGNYGIGAAPALYGMVNSVEFLNDHVDQAQRQAFVDAVNEVLPPSVSDLPSDIDSDKLRAAVKAGKPLSGGDKAAADLLGHVDAAVARYQKAQGVDTQGIEMGEHVYELVHRTMSSFPAAKVAFTPQGSFSADDKRIVRDYFWQHVSKEPKPEGADVDLTDDDTLLTAKPEKRESDDEFGARMKKVVGKRQGLFGEEDQAYGETSEGLAEAKARAEEKPDTGHSWQRYVRSSGGVPEAYANLQHIIRGAAMEKFADEYRHMMGRELKSAPQPIPFPERHNLGTMHKDRWQEAYDAQQADAARRYAKVAARAGGKFAKEEEGGRRENAEAQERKATRAQLVTFSELRQPVSRMTLGSRLEKQLVAPWSQVAPSFEAGGSYSLPFDVSMSGKRVSQQRAIKLLDRMKRVSLNQKTSGGKTLAGLGGFAHLHAQGKVKRAVYAVPAKQTAQWAMEATKFLKPGEYKHFAAGDASAEERRKAYADPSVQMTFVGHEALRDDITWAVAQHAFGGDEKKADEVLSAGPPKGAKPAQVQKWESDRNAMVQAAAKAQGWDWDMGMLDEGQKALNRKGKANSRLANALDGLTASMPYYVNATATAVKNDVSEAYDAAHKVRPDRFPASKARAWQRKYGTTGIEATGEAMRRELAPYFYAADAQTGNERVDHQRTVAMTPHQEKRYREVEDAYQAARKADDGSEAQFTEVEKLLPPSQLHGLTPEQKQTRLTRAMKALDNNRDRALERIVYGGDEYLLPDEVGVFQDVEHVAQQNAKAGLDGQQKPGLVFSFSPGTVRRLAQHLKSKGYRVGVIDGSTPPDRAEAIAQAFYPQQHLDRSDPEGSERAMREAAKFDILVCSDAVAQGKNLQRAGWHYDVDSPWTAMTLDQRHGRSDRIDNIYGTLDYHQARHDTTVDQRRRDKVSEKAPITGTFQKPYELLDQDGTGLMRDIIDERDRGAAQGLLSAIVPRRQAATA